MLHDLFLLSEFFDPSVSALKEEELMDSYGPQAVYMALSMGLIERKCSPCASGFQKNFYILSQSGLDLIMRTATHQPLQQRPAA